MSKEYKQYADFLEKSLEDIYAVVREARKKGLDPALVPEPEVAKDLAALVEGLVGPAGVAEGIRELTETLSREALTFKITEQIIQGKFGVMDPREAAEQAMRTALAILTEGITAAPIQGIAKVDIKTNPDRTKYLAIYYAGPIRSAGGTEQALTIIVGDHIRRLLKLDRYKPTDDEIGRFIEEVRLFERSIARFQYHISDEELRRGIKNIPVEVTGTESDPLEVSSFRNLPRIETNNVRGGALRVVNDGIVGRAAKVLTTIEKLQIEGWEWLGSLKEFSKKKKSGFMADVIAGRPIFSFPSRVGGFRLRYGRSRNTGLAAVGIHPATMLAVQNFLAAGTQLRLEGPGKGGITVPVDSIEPPVVRLKNGSVVRVSLQNFDSINKMIDSEKSLVIKTEKFLQSIAIMKRCNVFVTNDSALMHVASALGLKVIAIIGPTNKHYIHPWKTEHKIVSLNLDCAPCFFYSPKPLTCSRQDVQFKCIKELDVDMVYKII